MYKRTPIITASVASTLYFIIFIMLKYFMQERVVDVKGALIGAISFGVIIFIVHLLLKRRYP